MSCGRSRPVGRALSKAAARPAQAWTVKSVFVGIASRMLFADPAHLTMCNPGKTAE